VINPNIELVGVDMQKEQTDSDLFTHCCIRCNNKNIIRAAITGNKRLLTLGIASKDKISSLTAYWGTEIKYTAIEYALFNNNIKLLELLLHPQNKQFNDRVDNPVYLTNTVDTGKVSVMAYGHRVNKVQMTKGNKQGNNAFLEYEDNKKRDPFQYIVSDKFIISMLRNSNISVATY